MAVKINSEPMTRHEACMTVKGLLAFGFSEVTVKAKEKDRFVVITTEQSSQKVKRGAK